MKTILFVFSLALAQSVLAQPAEAQPRQHPALVEFDMSGLDAMRARVQAVINRPADLSPDKVAAFEKIRRAAEAGDTVAQLDLAQMLHDGEGTLRDVDAGLAWMQKSAEGGYGPAQAFLGVAYTLGQGMAIDRESGEYWSRKGAAQGVELANFTLAMHFENIHSSPEEQAHALHWLKYYAENGFIYAYNEIGYRLMMTAKDEAQRKEAFGWYMRAAKALDPPGLKMWPTRMKWGRACRRATRRLWAGMKWRPSRRVHRGRRASRGCWSRAVADPPAKGRRPSPLRCICWRPGRGTWKRWNGWSRYTIRANWNRRPIPRRRHCGAKSSGWPRPPDWA